MKFRINDHVNVTHLNRNAIITNVHYDADLEIEFLDKPGSWAFVRPDQITHLNYTTTFIDEMVSEE